MSFKVHTQPQPTSPSHTGASDPVPGMPACNNWRHPCLPPPNSAPVPTLTSCSPVAFALADDEVAYVPTEVAYDPVSPSVAWPRQQEALACRQGLGRTFPSTPGLGLSHRRPWPGCCFLVL